jgi:hypothetical protein
MHELAHSAAVLAKRMNAREPAAHSREKDRPELSGDGTYPRSMNPTR